MAGNEPFVTYLELRASTAEGDVGAGLSHTSQGLVLLHVLELAAYGEPRGAVTVVHDAGEHGGRYLPLAERLAQDGWAIALPDLRGHGRSEGERGHSNGVKEVVRDIGDVQDHLAYRQPDAPKVLIGQGLGAIWSLAYACERPDGIAALVLVAPLLAPSFTLPEKSGGLMKLFKKVGPTSPGRAGYEPARLTSAADEQRALQGDAHVHGIITLGAGEQAVAAVARYVPRIAKLEMPVLVLAGTQDPYVDERAVRALAGPKVDVEMFDGLMHDLLHESRASEVMERIASWLDRRLAR